MLANSPPMSTGDTTAVASVLVDIGIGLIAFPAFVVSCLAWRESRRSADASEESARTAARSAVAEEAAVALARREAEQREADRRDAAGPQFRPAETYTYHKGLLASGGTFTNRRRPRRHEPPHRTGTRHFFRRPALQIYR